MFICWHVCFQIGRAFRLIGVLCRWIHLLFKGLVPLAVVFLCVTVGLAAIETLKLERDIDKTTEHLNAFIDMGTKKMDVLASETHHLLLEAALTARTARKASEVQADYWNKEVPVLTAKSERILDNTNHLIVDADKAVNTYNQVGLDFDKQIPLTGDAAQKALLAAADALKQSGAAMDAATAVINNDDLKQTAKNLNATSSNFADASKSLAESARDVQGEVHKFTHPTVWGRIKSNVLFGIELFEKFVETRLYIRLGSNNSSLINH